MQLEVLAHRELGIEREGLRHVADAPAQLDVAGVDRPGRRAAPRLRVGGSSPVSIFMVVVLPQPFEPTKPKISPRSMVKLTWSTAVKSPKRRVRSRATMTGASPASRARRNVQAADGRAQLSGSKRDEGLFDRAVAPVCAFSSAGEPAARTRPASIATSQSKRSASSM